MGVNREKDTLSLVHILIHMHTHRQTDNLMK